MKRDVQFIAPLWQYGLFGLLVMLLVFTSCKKDVADACKGISAVTDIDGNVYFTVQIGTQCWIQSNLKVSRFRNGDTIANIIGHPQWHRDRNGAWCSYRDEEANDSLYGKLYNWYAVRDSRGLCPAGWHVPSEAEWTTLIDFLGGEAEAGDKMKGIAGWESPNMGDLNSSGFSGLPGGRRYARPYRSPTYIAGYAGIGAVGIWWSSTFVHPLQVFVRIIKSDSASAASWLYNLEYEAAGYSCRCVQD